MTTPNMNLTLPVVSTTPGPQWADQINQDLTTIDQHNHTYGNGASIPAAALDINADLSFNSYNALNLLSTQYADWAGVTPGFSSGIFVSNGNLHYKNGSGVDVPITNGPSVAAATGNITNLTVPGAVVFDLGASDFSFYADSVNATYANVHAATVKVHQEGTPSGLSVDLTAPNVMGASYTMTLPATAPLAASLLGWANYGTMQSILPDSSVFVNSGTGTFGIASLGVKTANIDNLAVTTAKIADGSITSIKMASVLSAQTVTSGNLTVSGTGGWQAVYGSSATLPAATTTNRPIIITLQSDAGANASTIGGTTTNPQYRVRAVSGLSTYYANFVEFDANRVYAPSSISCVFVPPSTGTWSFNLETKAAIGSTSRIQYCVLFVYQV